jgi:hypothetical protein
MAERLRARGLVALLLAALALSGCSGAAVEPVPTPTGVDLSTYAPESDGNGVGLLSPAAARDAVLAAVRAAGSVEVSGSYSDAGSGRSIRITRIGTAETYTASIEVDDTVSEVVVDGGTAWLDPAPPVAELSDLPAGEWSCVSTSDATIERFALLLRPLDLMEELTADAGGLSAPGEGTVDLLLGAEGTAGVLTVATTGRPLPTRLVRADDTGSLEVTFREWGAAPAEVEPPTDC